MNREKLEKILNERAYQIAQHDAMLEAKLRHIVKEHDRIEYWRIQKTLHGVD